MPAAPLEPAAAAHRIVVKLKRVRLDLEAWCAVQGVDFSDAQESALDRQELHPARRMSPNASGSTLPPERMTATEEIPGGSLRWSTAAAATAPLGSTRIFK